MRRLSPGGFLAWKKNISVKIFAVAVDKRIRTGVGEGADSSGAAGRDARPLKRASTSEGGQMSGSASHSSMPV